MYKPDIEVDDLMHAPLGDWTFRNHDQDIWLTYPCKSNPEEPDYSDIIHLPIRKQDEPDNRPWLGYGMATRRLLPSLHQSA